MTSSEHASFHVSRTRWSGCRRPVLGRGAKICRREAWIVGPEAKTTHYTDRRKPRPDGGIGRRDGFKIRCPNGRVGSSPTPGTTWGFFEGHYEGFFERGWHRLADVRRSLIERRLKATTVKLKKATEDLRAAEWAVSQLEDEAAEARTRALVSDHPEAQRDAKQIQRQWDIQVSNRAELASRVQALEQDQNDLLDAYTAR